MNFIFAMYIYIYIYIYICIQYVYDSRKYCVWQVIAVALHVMKRSEPYKNVFKTVLNLIPN